MNKKIQTVEREHELSLLHQQTLITPQEFQKAQDEIQGLKQTVQTKDEKLSGLLKSRETLLKEIQEIKENNKPKEREIVDKFPNWSWIQDQIPFPIDEFYNLCKSLNFNECIMTLIRELQKTKKDDFKIEQEKRKARYVFYFILY